MKRDIAYLVLTTLTDAAQFSPIPYLREAAGLALTILQIVNVCIYLGERVVD